MGCSQKKCCKYLTVSLVPATALVLALIFFMGIVALPIIFEELTRREKYGIVIDAGSSHTQVFLYKWNLPTRSVTTATQRVVEVHNCSGKAGISSYTENPQDAGNAFKDCLSYMTDVLIPSDDARNTTHLYLGATAGMRLLEYSNKSLSDEIMAAVKQTLDQNKCCKKDIKKQIQSKIISGQEEGSSAWISVNYLDDKFEKNQSTGKHLVDVSSESISGILDMGGASMQIAFDDPPHSLPEYTTNLLLFGKTYNLYSRTYLCYGLNEAMRRYLAYLALKAGSKTVENPCLPTDATIKQSSSYLFNSSCTSGDAAVDVFGSTLSPSGGGAAAASQYTFIGTGSYDKCSSLLREVFNFSRCNQPSNSSRSVCVNGTYLTPPTSDISFVAMDGFYYVFNETIPQFVGKSINSSLLTKFIDTIDKKFCNVTVFKDSEKNQLCFNGMYVYHVLQNGFGFSQSKGWSMRVDLEISGVTLDWALGYMVKNTLNIGVKDPYVAHPYGVADLVVGMVMLSILCFVFVVFFLFTFFACKNVLRSRNGYAALA